jgi:hypothetical protein
LRSTEGDIDGVVSPNDATGSKTRRNTSLAIIWWGV